MYDVIVLGSGVVGMNTAYWCANAGLKTLVVDRQPLAGNETSYANGGQISVSFAEPWASLATLRKALFWLFEKDAPLRFSPQLDWRQWRWLMLFIAEALPHRYRRNVTHLVQLGLYSRHLLKQVRDKHQLRYQQLEHGILQIYRDHSAFDGAKHTASLMRSLGCDRQVIATEQAIDIEPTLQHIAHEIKGATYTAGDETGDAHEFCLALKSICEELGTDFQFHSRIEKLHKENGLISVQLGQDGQRDIITAPHIVMACGSHSASLLQEVDIDLPVYPAKGYSVSIPIQNPQFAPNVSVTDDQYKVVFTRLGDHLRVAGTAEIAGYDLTINEHRCERMVKHAQWLFPDIGDFNSPRYWAGLRPATPSNIPFIGATQYPNLWLNTGHGTLGWTLGCGSGKLLADKISKGETDFSRTRNRNVKIRAYRT